MKILVHGVDDTAYEKSIYCKKFISFCGIDFYFSEDVKENTREYFCNLKGTADLLKQLDINCNCTVEEAETAIKRMSEEEIFSLCTVDGELKRIENECERGEWMRDEEIDFCELMGKYKLAERVRKNKAKFTQKRRRAFSEGED